MVSTVTEMPEKSVFHPEDITHCQIYLLSVLHELQRVIWLLCVRWSACLEIIEEISVVVKYYDYTRNNRSLFVPWYIERGSMHHILIILDNSIALRTMMNDCLRMAMSHIINSDISYGWLNVNIVFSLINRLIFQIYFNITNVPHMEFSIPVPNCSCKRTENNGRQNSSLLYQ